MKKLLIHSNSPLAPTGYGAQTALFAPLLNEHYKVGISSFYGLEGAPIVWKGIPVFPGLGGEYGNEYMGLHAANFSDTGNAKDLLVLSLLDVWVLQPERVRQLNMCSWVPVDHDPVPPAVAGYFQRSGAIPIAMSRFGQEQLELFDPLYVPHGVDADTYKPIPQDDAREELGLKKDAFIVGMVAANKGRPSRKGFQQAFEAFRLFREKHTNAYLYLHTLMNASWGEGEYLAEMLQSLGIPEDAILLANQYRIQFAPAPGATMAKLYSAFDVLLNPSMGEGFGIPVLEAQACGTPAIVTDFSAMKEVCEAGWKVKGRAFWSPQRSWQAIADVGEIVGALEECYNLTDEEKASLSKKARRHALNYAAPKVLEEHFLPALEEVQERLDARQPRKLKAAA